MTMSPFIDAIGLIMHLHIFWFKILSTDTLKITVIYLCFFDMLLLSYQMSALPMPQSIEPKLFHFTLSHESSQEFAPRLLAKFSNIIDRDNTYGFKSI